jgi:predicted nucleotidyltransferase
MNAYLEARRDAIAAYCRKWKIVEFSLFGSVLREDFGAGSNVDVLVRFRPDVMRRYADAVAMENELADIFGRDVELVDYRSIVDWSENHIRRKAILESAQVIYSAPGGRAARGKEMTVRDLNME